MNTKVIYQPGQLNIRTSVSEVNGIEYADYSDPVKTALDYLKELNENNTGEQFVIIPWQEAAEFIKKAQDAKLINKWEEITEESWDEALNCLPPERWKTVDGVNIFRMCEYYTDNITMHYAKVSGKYFKANRRVTDDYGKLARQVLKLI